MTIAEAVFEKLQTLPEYKQRRVMQFVESLAPGPAQVPEPLRSPRGLWADLNFDVTADDLSPLGVLD